jgi:hypothetical protein
MGHPYEAGTSYVELGATERAVTWVFAVLQILLMIGRLLR